MILGLIMACAAVAQDVQPPVFFAGNDELRQYLFEAAQNNPNLKARYEDWLAALEKLPQVTTLEDPMFGYTQFLQSDQYLAQLMIEQKFPWFGTLRTRGDKAALEADAALARFYAARNQLIPREQQIYESLLATYSSGVDSMEGGAQPGAEFVDLQNSLRAILEFQLEQARASRDLQMAATELEMLMGGPWTGKETEAQIQIEKPAAPENAPKTESQIQK